MRVLVTGGAGFIGSHLVDRLLEREGCDVVAIDNFDPFYPEPVKRGNLRGQLDHPRFRFIEADLLDPTLRSELDGEHFDVVVHLAAKAGVRGSLADPMAYHRTNVLGTQAMINLARSLAIPRFIFGSSSSVYGISPSVPWVEDDAELLPISPYACTKVAGESLAHAYSHLDDTTFVALRLFTVYGPRQRPDLAIHHFARKILAGEPIQLFGDGSSLRDYTFVSDIVDGIWRAIGWDASRFGVFNLGASHPVTLLQLVEQLAGALGIEPEIEHVAPVAGDVPQTYASIEKSRSQLGYDPQVSLPDGLKAFARWVREDEHRSVQTGPLGDGAR